MDPFEVPSNVSNQAILVVEGRIGNEETRIQLSRTANLEAFTIRPELNAIVRIENEQGNVVGQLSEVGAGGYFLDIDLTVNEKYRMRIETGNREVYLSNYSTLVSTPPIADLDVKFDTAGLNLEILLSTEDPSNNTRYYLWDYTETYEYNSRFRSVLEFEGGQIIPRRDENDIHVCWETDNSSGILVQSSIQFEKDIISKKRIVSYSLNETDKFKRAYSILVNQYALSREEFEFWSLLEKNTESLGTLFDPQPSQISTNLACISDPQKRVIGYVGSSSTTQKRIFISGKDLPRNPELVVSFCRLLSVPESGASRIFANQNNVPVSWNDFGGVLYSTKYCTDCREMGGTNVRPSFWF